MTFTPAGRWWRCLPPTVLDPFDAKSTGHVRPSGPQCWCTASVTAPGLHAQSGAQHVRCRPRCRIRDSESTISPFFAHRAAREPRAAAGGNDGHFRVVTAAQQARHLLGRARQPRMTLGAGCVDAG